MPISFQIQGFAELIDQFKTYPNEVKQGVDDELIATAYEIITDAKVLAPVDVGALRNSIDVTVNEPLNKQVSALVNYAAYVEFGTGGLVNVPEGLEEYAIQFKGAGIRKINMGARPYFFPAFNKAVDELLPRLKVLMEEKFKK